MRLPIIVNGKTFYMDEDDWERERKWREEADRHFPKIQEHLRAKKDETNHC